VSVLTIAHRINTIMDYDRVMVLDKGEVAEFDSPAKLMKTPNSMFSSLAARSGTTLSDIEEIREDEEPKII